MALISPPNFSSDFNLDFLNYAHAGTGPHANVQGPPRHDTEDCDTSNVYGPFNQTLFLGCSVMGFSASVGWNGQTSEVTVQLVEDTCPAPSERPKVYWNKNLVRSTTTSADPGFAAEAPYNLDIIGCPVYFRVGYFEFSGLIQSWDKQNSQSGKPVYVVKLSDPRAILEGSQLIIGDYAGAVFNTNVLDGVYGNSVFNVINVFGFLQSYGDVYCPPMAQFQPGVYGETSSTIDPMFPLPDGVVFGNPSNYFGSGDEAGLYNNNNGTRWSAIKGALSMLTSQLLKFPSAYCPFGRLVHRGVLRQTLDTAEFNGYGLISTYVSNGAVPYTEYLIDLSDIPDMPTHWRLNGTSVSIMEALDKVLRDSGRDYYVELVPIISGVGFLNFIKVRTVSRVNAQPMNQIAAHVSGATNIIQNSHGREFRNEPTSAFIIGGKKHFVYQSDLNKDHRHMMVQYFGLDNFKNAIDPYTMDYAGHSWWQAELPSEAVDLGMSILTFNGAKVLINELELLFALAGFDRWLSFIKSYEEEEEEDDEDAEDGEDGETEASDAERGGWHGAVIGAQQDAPALMTSEIIPDEFTGNLNASHLDLIKLVDGTALPRDIPAFKQGNIFNKDFDKTLSNDLQVLFNWVQSIAREFYGKKIQVGLPFVCGAYDSESDQVIMDIQTTDSAWTEVYPVIDLKEPDLSFFRTEDGRLQAFVRMPGNTDVSELSTDDYIIHRRTNPQDADDHFVAIYVKCQVEKELVYLDFENKIGPRVVITLPSRFEPAVPEESEDDPATRKRKHTRALGFFLQVVTGKQNVTEDLLDKIGANCEALISPLGFPAIYPDGAALPLLNNSQTYGPWSSPGPPGYAVVEQQDDLTPWEFGGVSDLNTAGESIADAQVTNMVQGEMGSLNVAGYPKIPLGAELGASYPVTHPHLIENRTWETVYFRSGRYIKVDYGRLDGGGLLVGTYGPSITNVTTSLNEQGATTTYTLRTFTPQFGKFAKLNAERLRLVGRNRVKQITKLRKNAIASASTSLALAENYATKKNAYSPFYEQASKPQSRSQTPQGSSEVITGQIVPKKKDSDDKRSPVSVDSVQDTSLHAVRKGYDKKAFMGWDGLIRPVSVAGDGDLPQYVASEPVWSNQLLNTRGAQGPIRKSSGGGSEYYHGADETSQIVDIEYTNPLSNPSDSLLSDKYSGPKTGHDFDIVGRRNLAPTSLVMSVGIHEEDDEVDDENGEESEGSESLTVDKPKPETDYTEDYRLFAMRGPILLQSWGYDTDGKPVPNKADSVDDAKVGGFTTDDLQSKFLDNWLQRPETWPVAPVDLRFDRARGMWVSPPAHRNMVVTLKGELEPTKTVSAEVDQSLLPDLFDDNGNQINQAYLTVQERGIYSHTLPADTPCIVGYNPYLDEYNILEVEMSGVPITVVTNVCCSEDNTQILVDTATIRVFGIENQSDPQCSGT